MLIHYGWKGCGCNTDTITVMICITLHHCYNLCLIICFRCLVIELESNCAPRRGQQPLPMLQDPLPMIQKRMAWDALARVP